MERFYKLEKPESFSDEEIDFLRGRVNKTHHIKGKDGFVLLDEFENENKLCLKSIISERENTILYEGILNDKLTVVVKATIIYEIGYDKEELIEQLFYEEDPDLLLDYDDINESYILNSDQWNWVSPKLKKAMERGTYYREHVPEIIGEARTHIDVYKYSVDNKIPFMYPKYYGLFRDRKRPIMFYVMEKLKETGIRSIIRYSFERVAIDILTALRPLHGIRKVHRDITPWNIGILDNENVALFDFGISTFMSIANWSPEDESKKIFLRTGNPITAPVSAYEGSKAYYSGDLEQLVYVLELTDGVMLPWIKIKDDQIVYEMKKKYKSENPKIQKLLKYSKRLKDKKPDFDLCISFFTD
jgi:tRNA A-37 threonylcarbamoyl transferase component Bud32